MKRLGLMLASLLVAVSAMATTTVTGTIQTLGTGASPAGTFVRFWLRGCGGNQPTVNGVAVIGPSQGGVFFFDLTANGSGVVSGTVYSTRDVTGNNGGDISCGGSATAVWYGVQLFYAGKGGPEVPVHAKNTTTLDITQLSPISTIPVTTAPTGDTTYARLDASNQPFQGNVNPSGNGTLSLGSTGNRWNANLNSANVTTETVGTLTATTSTVTNQTVGTAGITTATIGGSTVGSMNGAYYPLSCAGGSAPAWCSGSDIGAWINAAAAACTAASALQCRIVIQPNTAQLTISTPITYINNESLECVNANVIDNTTASDSGAQLYYNGTGTAITMNAKSGRFVGCDLLLGASVAVGIQEGNYSNYIRDAGIRGGGTSTQLVHVGSATVPTEDAHIEKSRFSDFIGIAIACDHANDTFLTDLTMYGKTSNTTGITILMDSACTGTQATNLVGGNSGKNFLKVQYTLGGNYPTYLFARNTQCDLSSGDCYLFDSTLGSALIDYTFLDCWAAGATGRGFHISGGSNIRLNGCKIRENGLDGVLIDSGVNVSNGIHIEHNLIEGNNQSNTASTNGITVSGHPVAVSVTGNLIQNAPEVGGNQAYAFSSSSDIEGLIFTENFCSNNVTGCANLSSITSTKLTNFGNININAGASAEPNYLLGLVSAAGFSNVTNNGNSLLCSSTQPSISGFGTGSLGSSPNGSCSFFLITSTGGGSTGTITLPAAAHGWNCYAQNQSRGAVISQTANTTTSATLTNYGSTFAATAWTGSDVILVSCFGR